MEYGVKLRQLRKERKMSQGELAKELQVTPAAISQFETGIRMPALPGIVKTADLMGVTTDYLLGRTQEKNLPVELLNEDNQRICRSYDSLSDSSKTAFKEFLEFLQKREEPLKGQ